MVWKPIVQNIHLMTSNLTSAIAAFTSAFVARLPRSSLVAKRSSINRTWRSTRTFACACGIPAAARCLTRAWVLKRRRGCGEVAQHRKHFFGTFILALTNFGTFVTYRLETSEDRRNRNCREARPCQRLSRRSRASFSRTLGGAHASRQFNSIGAAPRAAARYTALPRDSVANAH
jgi:hypothetical protein